MKGRGEGGGRDTVDLDVLLTVKWLHKMMAEMWAKWKQDHPLASLLSIVIIQYQ